MTTATTPTPDVTGARSPEPLLTVLIADKFERSGIEAAEKLGCRVEFRPELTTGDLPDAMREVEPEVLVVRSTKVPRDVIEAGEKLRLVIRAGAGYDTIDAQAASERAVYVANCPGMNSTAVAELVFGLLVACDRRIPAQTADLRRGVWDKKGYSKASGLKDHTMGIVGVGNIGRLVARRALAFEMNVLYHDIVACEELDRNERVERVGLDDLLRRSDYVSLHVPAVESTRELINEKTLALMKPDAVLINTTRGSVIDEDALVAALEGGRLRAAAADVYANEPAAGDHEISSKLAQLPNFFGTHHVGASTEQAQAMIAEEVVHIIDSYVRTAQVPNCVNLVARSPAVCQLTVRYRNHTGVLAHVFHVLSDAGINTEEMGNTVFDGARAACVRIRLDSCPTSGQLEVVRQNENVLSLDLSMIDR